MYLSFNGPPFAFRIKFKLIGLVADTLHNLAQDVLQPYLPLYSPHYWPPTTAKEKCLEVDGPLENSVVLSRQLWVSHHIRWSSGLYRISEHEGNYHLEYFPLNRRLVWLFSLNFSKGAIDQVISSWQITVIVNVPKLSSIQRWGRCSTETKHIISLL